MQAIPDAHPAAARFRDMTEEEYERLKASIREHGYDADQPVWLIDGLILDGRHRYRACVELGILPVTRPWVDEYSTPEAFTDAYNDARRAETKAERNERIARLREQGMSTRVIAEKTGVSKSTIGDTLAGVRNRTPAVNAGTSTETPADPPVAPPPQSTPPPEPETRPGYVRGKDGKWYPATRGTKPKEWTKTEGAKTRGRPRAEPPVISHTGEWAALRDLIQARWLRIDPEITARALTPDGVAITRLVFKDISAWISRFEMALKEREDEKEHDNIIEFRTTG